MTTNDHLILVGGKTASGKSMCLRNLKDPQGVLYLNCEAGKKLPFKSGFTELTITSPEVVKHAFIQAEDKQKGIHTIVVDSLTFLMDMYESQCVLTATNTMKAWGNYAQFLKTLMLDLVAKSTKNVIFLAHTSDVANEAEMITETLVKLKGSIMNTGVESYFTNVISCKRVPTKKLTETNDLLTITEDEKLDQFKHVFLTRLTAETQNERVRAPLGMWERAETYIDNDIQLVIDRLHKYYA
ncbi:MAG: AAA family ATPase [Nanoarchaeota archaeon]|nr:AAA family ATPase [Nanoarchaeota archaeon]